MGPMEVSSLDINAIIFGKLLKIMYEQKKVICMYKIFSQCGQSQNIY